MASLEELGGLVKEKRRGRPIREVAREIGISHATLIRIEKGHLPDLENYQKICRWIGMEDSDALRVPDAAEAKSLAEVHFRKARTVSPKTAQALAKMILAAQTLLATQKP